MWRRTTLLTAVAAVVTAGCSGQVAGPKRPVDVTISVSGPRFDSVGALRAGADAVVLGRVGPKVREHPIVNADGEEFYREVVHTVTVERSFLQPGLQVALADEITVVTPDAAAAIPNARGLGSLQGQQVLLFLNVAPDPEIAQFMVTGEDNGIFDVRDGSARVRSSVTDLHTVDVRVDDILPPSTS